MTCRYGFQERRGRCAPAHGNGAWAEFMLVPETFVAPILTSLTPDELAALDRAFPLPDHKVPLEMS